MTDYLSNMAENTDTQAEPTTARYVRITQLALLLAVLALFIVIWQWLNTRQHFNQIEHTLSEKLTRFDAHTQQSLAIAKMAEERSVANATEIALLKQKLAESKNQQEALQTLYNELADNQETRVVAEVEQLLVIANQQLQLAANVKSALLALQTAQNQLQQLNTSQATALNHSLQLDIKKLQDLPIVDIAEMSGQIEDIARHIDMLTLVSDRHPSPKTKSATQAPESIWYKLTQEIWQDIRNIIRLERIDRPEPPLLEVNQVFFLKENIKLRLLTARIALLQHDENTYRKDLKTAENWLNSYFDTREMNAILVLNAIKKLSANSIVIQVPDISESVNLASKYKLSLENTANPDSVHQLSKPH